MKKHYHQELVQFVIEDIFDERMAGEERILTSEDTLAKIASRADAKFCRHHGSISVKDVQRIYQAFHSKQQAAKQKFIGEHLKIDS